MNTKSIPLAMLIVISLGASAFAQCACSAPATTAVPVAPTYTANYAPTVTYYAPDTCTAGYAPTTTYYAPTTTTYYAPTTSAYYAPTTTYYAPAESYTSYYAPTTTYYAPETYATYYAPTTTYYAPTTAYYAPAPAAYTAYYTPTTTYYGATPYAAYAPVVQPAVTSRDVVGTSVYGTPKVYVRGEPLRNSLRSLTP